MKRTLRLTREVLAELTADDLRIAVGGAGSGVTCPVAACVGDLVTQLAGCAGGYSYNCPSVNNC